MEKIKVQTELFGKDDIFKVLAVAKATGHPILLVGPPGTGKTRALLDFSLGLATQNITSSSTEEEVKAAKSAAARTAFILETDEGTKSSEVKGRIDMETLLTTNKYKLNSPITKAKFILINEVDKASPGLRNSLLGIMNEGFLFNGQEKIKCNWDILCGSCNIIPKEEEENPFWDRFVFKYKVNRIGRGQLMKHFHRANKSKTLELTIPDEAELDQLAATIPHDKIKKFMEVVYDKMTDRTASFTPRIISAVSVVYGMQIGRAMIKTCELMVGSEASKELAKKLESGELTGIRSQIEIIPSLQDYDQIVQMVDAIKKEVIKCSSLGKLGESDVQELKKELEATLKKNQHYSHPNDGEDILAGVKGSTYGDAPVDTATQFQPVKN